MNKYTMNQQNPFGYNKFGVHESDDNKGFYLDAIIRALQVVDKCDSASIKLIQKQFLDYRFDDLGNEKN